jgi:tetratricopeptide (TPR) repeat protein
MIAFMDSDYNEAISLFEKLMAQDPAFMPGHLFLASSYGIVGLKEQSKATIEKMFQINPDFKISKLNKGSIKVPAIAELFRQNLIELGVPLVD